MFSQVCSLALWRDREQVHLRQDTPSHTTIGMPPHGRSQRVARIPPHEAPTVPLAFPRKIALCGSRVVCVAAHTIEERHDAVPLAKARVGLLEGCEETASVVELDGRRVLRPISQCKAWWAGAEVLDEDVGERTAPRSGLEGDAP